MTTPTLAELKDAVVDAARSCERAYENVSLRQTDTAFKALRVAVQALEPHLAAAPARSLDDAGTL